MKTIKTATAYLVFALIFMSCSQKENIIGLKEKIQHDDFEYSVQNVEKTERIGNIESKGMFYLVTFRVENDAKRVEHKWDNNIAYVTDKNETIYKNIYDLQINLKKVRDFSLKERYITYAGQNEETILVFDTPNDVKEPYLKVNGEFLMGDLFDGSQFKNTKVKLF